MSVVVTMSKGRRRLAGIMFTDMVGYTALGHRNESLSLALVEEQRKLIRPILAKHEGREVKTIGDAFLVEFRNAVDAVRCAYDIQRAIREFNFSLASDRRIHLRIGLHVGEVVESQGDISGDAVNVASRIEPLAEDGGVCMTRQVYDHVRNKIDLPLSSVGPRFLKNLTERIEAFRLVMPWETNTASPSPQPDPRRIAVLPFANMSPDPSDEYFADGMTEELISTLSLIEALRVISRTSVMQYKELRRNVVEIGKELNVGSVLEGSVRKAGNKIRVTAQLVDSQNGEHLWVSSYDKQFDDIFAIQTEVAGKIAEALRVKLVSGTVLDHKHNENMEAYALYLNGRVMLDKGSEDAVLGASKLLLEAIHIFPDYARAHSALADAYNLAADRGFIDKAEGYSKAKDALTKALELDDTIVEAHASLGVNLLSRLNDDGKLEIGSAEREFRRAIELNPSYATAHQWYSLCLLEMGRINDAIDEIKQASELDPLSPIIALRMADLKALAGRVDEAIAVCDKLIKGEPSFALAYAERSVFFTLLKMEESSLADAKAYRDLSTDEATFKLGIAQIHAWFGEQDKALSIVQKAAAKSSKSSGELLQFIARIYAILGERDEFFAWCEKAIAKKRFSVVLLRYSPFYDKVRNDPRFPELFRKLGLSY